MLLFCRHGHREAEVRIGRASIAGRLHHPARELRREQALETRDLRSQPGALERVFGRRTADTNAVVDEKPKRLFLGEP